MTQAVAKIIKEVEQLSSSEYFDLFDEMILRRPQVSGAVKRSQLDIVKTRIANVESGTVE